MRVFEFHFNPKKEDHFFDSFIFEPANSYEKKLGALFIVGEINNGMPQNAGFLDNIAVNIKQKYYSLTAKSLEKSLSDCLNKTNDFLSEEVKNDNVSWLGNLNFAVLSLKDFEIVFSKTGDVKILILRDGQIIDASKNLEKDDIEPYPLKIFFNVVSGKLGENDKIVLLTKEVYEFLSREKILERLSRAKDIDKKILKTIFPKELFEKGEGAKTSGACLIISLSKELLEEKNWKEIISEKSDILSPASSFIKNIGKKIKNFNLPKWNFKMPKIKGNPEIKNNILIVAVLVLLLIIGFLLFQRSKIIKQNENRNSLSEINNAMIQADNVSKDTAKQQLKDAWDKITEIAKENNSKEVISLKDSLKNKLEKIYNLETIENPQLLAELNYKDVGFSPQRILYSYPDFYLYNPDFPNLYVYEIYAKKGSTFTANHNLDFADDSGTALFFSAPDTILSFENGSWKETSIKNQDNLSCFASRSSNLYFAKTNNEILKYGYNPSFKWNEPEDWLKTKDKDQQRIKSIGVDDSLWTLNADNSISKFTKGEFQEKKQIDIFPLIGNITKIKIKDNLQYIYMMDPKENRIIITDKNLNLTRQIKSTSFDDLKDFTVANNGSIIWVLNGWKIYQLFMQ